MINIILDKGFNNESESKIYKKSPGKSRLPSNFFLLLLKINKDIIITNLPRQFRNNKKQTK